jgi:serine/threonine-protein kinase
MTAERTAKACLLAPASPEDTFRLAALADRAVAAGRNPELLVWFHLAQGLARYRLGKDALAAEALRTVRDETRASENCRTTALAYLAMAESRLGDSDGAKRSLEEARTRQTMNTPDPELPPDWHDWLISEIALREAEALIGRQPPPASLPAREH